MLCCVCVCIVNAQRECVVDKRRREENVCAWFTEAEKEWSGEFFKGIQLLLKDICGL